MIEIFFDGACEPRNPGGACGMGYVIYVDDKKVHTGSAMLDASPENSNNVAEYFALLLALQHIRKDVFRNNHVPSSNMIYIIGDSKLVINQLGGYWRVNGGLYYNYYLSCRQIIDKLREEGFTLNYKWIPREMNADADNLSKLRLAKAGVKINH